MAVFDIDLAARSHVQAIRALMRYIDCRAAGTQPAIATADACPLGAWLAGAGAAHRHLAEHGRVRALHDEFHARLRDILVHAAEGRSEEAYACLNPSTPFSRTSRQLLIAFGDLSDALGSATATPLPNDAVEVRRELSAL
jgi:hypothetical protein